MSTMKAYATLGGTEIGMIDIPKPKCGPTDAILRPIVLAPCTSDVHTLQTGTLPYGVPLGHEAVGQIVEVGELVKDFKVGDKVVVPAITPEWGTVASQEGHSQHCNGLLTGFKFCGIMPGSFSELFKVIEADSNLALLPEGMDPVTASMACDMMTTGFHGDELAEIKLGETVCVIGIGPVGLMSVKGAVLMGASRVFAVGTRPNCVKLAKEYGATDIISYKDGNVLEQIMQKTNGEGVDKVIVAGGDAKAFAEAITMCKPGGVISNINYFSDIAEIPIPLGPWGFGMAHKDIRGGLCPGGRARTEKLLKLIQYGRVDPSGLITHRYEGFDKIADAFKIMTEKPADLIKPVVIIHYDD